MKRDIPIKIANLPHTTAKTAKIRNKPVETENRDGRLGFLMHDVSRHDGMIQSDLANLLDIGKAALGGLIERLEASSFIERRANDHDRRVERVYLFSGGMKIEAECASAATA